MFPVTGPQEFFENISTQSLLSFYLRAVTKTFGPIPSCKKKILAFFYPDCALSAKVLRYH